MSMTLREAIDVAILDLETFQSLNPTLKSTGLLFLREALAQPEQRGKIAYWAAADSDGNLQMTMSADDANGGMAARQEVNDWINEAIADGEPATHLVALYTAPPSPTVPDDTKRLDWILEDMRQVDFYHLVGGRGNIGDNHHRTIARQLIDAAMLAAAPAMSEAGPDIRPAPVAIDIGDAVHHGPSGEDWIVARVDDGYVYPAGWPPCRAVAADCTLIKSATAEERAEMIERLQRIPSSDPRHIAAAPEPPA